MNEVLRTVPTPHGGGIALAITWFYRIILSIFYRVKYQIFFMLSIFGAVISIVSF